MLNKFSLSTKGGATDRVADCLVAPTGVKVDKLAVVELLRSVLNGSFLCLYGGSVNR